MCVCVNVKMLMYKIFAKEKMTLLKVSLNLQIAEKSNSNKLYSTWKLTLCCIWLEAKGLEKYIFTHHSLCLYIYIYIYIYKYFNYVWFV